MNYRLLVLGLSLGISTSAMAVDVARCPQHVKVQASVVKVYKDSKYSRVPGWKEAQTALNDNDSIQLSLAQTTHTKKSCRYEDLSGNFAVLGTAEFLDREEGVLKNDQLTLRFTIDESSFVSFIPVESYALTGIKTFFSPYPIKIKARLNLKDGKTWTNIDMGLISVAIE